MFPGSLNDLLTDLGLRSQASKSGVEGEACETEGGEGVEEDDVWLQEGLSSEDDDIGWKTHKSKQLDFLKISRKARFTPTLTLSQSTCVTPPSELHTQILRAPDSDRAEGDGALTASVTNFFNFAQTQQKAKLKKSPPDLDLYVNDPPSSFSCKLCGFNRYELLVFRDRTLSPSVIRRSVETLWERHSQGQDSPLVVASIVEAFAHELVAYDSPFIACFLKAIGSKPEMAQHFLRPSCLQIMKAHSAFCDRRLILEILGQSSLLAAVWRDRNLAETVYKTFNDWRSRDILSFLLVQLLASHSSHAPHNSSRIHTADVDNGRGDKVQLEVNGSNLVEDFLWRTVQEALSIQPSQPTFWAAVAYVVRLLWLLTSEIVHTKPNALREQLMTSATQATLLRFIQQIDSFYVESAGDIGTVNDHSAVAPLSLRFFFEQLSMKRVLDSLVQHLEKSKAQRAATKTSHLRSYFTMEDSHGKFSSPLTPKRSVASVTRDSSGGKTPAGVVEAVKTPFDGSSDVNEITDTNSGSADDLVEAKEDGLGATSYIQSALSNWLSLSQVPLTNWLDFFPQKVDARSAAVSDAQTAIRKALRSCRALREDSSREGAAPTSGRCPRCKSELERDIWPRGCLVPLSRGELLLELDIHKSYVISSSNHPTVLHVLCADAVALTTLDLQFKRRNEAMNNEGLFSHCTSCVRVLCHENKIHIQDNQLLYKCPEDLRQDALVVTLLKYFDQAVFKDVYDLEAHLLTYDVLPLSCQEGFIQFIATAVPISQLRTPNAYAGVTQTPHNGVPDSVPNSVSNASSESVSVRGDEAIDRLILSTAAYSVMMYVMAVGDRHQDNILFDRATSCLFHVDYGYILGNDPKPFAVTPMKLTTEMLAAMGGVPSRGFSRFCTRAVELFRIVRRHHNELLNLLSMVYHSQIHDVSVARYQHFASLPPSALIPVSLLPSSALPPSAPPHLRSTHTPTHTPTHNPTPPHTHRDIHTNAHANTHAGIDRAVETTLLNGGGRMAVDKFLGGNATTAGGVGAVSASAKMLGLQAFLEPIRSRLQLDLDDDEIPSFVIDRLIRPSISGLLPSLVDRIHDFASLWR